MNQERYKEYRKELSLQGFNVIETTVWMPTEETYKILEDRFGPMPWHLLKFPENVEG